VHMDLWVHQSEMEEVLDDALAEIELYEADGARWLATTNWGDVKDRVVVRADGRPTYFAVDVPHMRLKWDRGHERLIYVLGADHHGYIARLKAIAGALGHDPEQVEILIYQLVQLTEAGAARKVSKRRGDVVFLDDLLDEIGVDAARWHLLSRSFDQAIDIDVDLARERTEKNPVYYVQYAHARIASVLKQASERGLPFDQAAGLEALASLGEPAELALMREISRWPEVVRLGAEQRAPHLVVHYLRELAQAFHACYAALQFIVDDAKVRNGRLALIAAARQVLQNALAILGVSAPETM